MKLSISLPQTMAQEIRDISAETEKNVSWWLQQAWTIARTRLLQNKTDLQLNRRKALKKMASLQGVLKKTYPKTTSVSLAKKAFL